MAQLQSKLPHSCKHCGKNGILKQRKQGSFFIELILWFFLILPGFAYRIWRMRSSYWECPECISKDRGFYRVVYGSASIMLLVYVWAVTLQH